MKITSKDVEAIVVQRSREAIPNAFLTADPKGVRPIDGFVDGKTRRIELDGDDSLNGTIDRLRVAAKALDPQKGVRVAFDGDRKTARSFRFELIPYTVRVAKPTE